MFPRNAVRHTLGLVPHHVTVGRVAEPLPHRATPASASAIRREKEGAADVALFHGDAGDARSEIFPDNARFRENLK